MDPANKYYFGSDNFSPAHPEILQSVQEANHENVPSYGKDKYTQETLELFKEHFGDDIAVYPVFSGTAANVTAIASVVRPYEAVICSDQAHLHTDEGGASERHAGMKLLALPSEHGKISAAQIARYLSNWNTDEHRVQPKVISLTQATEYGTTYSVEELKAISEVAHQNKLLLHVDGARIANAAVSLGATFKEMLTHTGVDLLSFGGTKNGMMFGEAVIFFGKDRFPEYRFFRMQGLQLASKMRYLSAQFIPYLQNDLWKKMATHANSMASLLAETLREVETVQITRPVQANAIFAIFKPEHIIELHKEFYFYEWNSATHECRLMFSWYTKEEEVRYFAKRIKEVCR